MRTSTLLLISIATAASSQSALSGFIPQKQHIIADNLQSESQVVIMAHDPKMPSSAQDNPEFSSSSMFHSTIISDVLGKSRSINIFSSFTRDIKAIADRLSSSSASTTLLAPVNSAIEGLPRKPWEDPNDAVIYEGDDGKDKAKENLKKFVESHIVAESPWAEGKKVRTLAGQEIWWLSDGDKKMIQPGNIEVESVAEKVANGEVWILKGVRNYT